MIDAVFARRSSQDNLVSLYGRAAIHAHILEQMGRCEEARAAAEQRMRIGLALARKPIA